MTESESCFYHITQAGKPTRLPTIPAALSAAKDGGFIWLDFVRSSPERDSMLKQELTLLVEPFGLHPLAIEDCTDENQIPKIEDFPSNTFVLFNSFRYSEKELTIGEVDLFIGRNFLVTVSSGGADGARPFGSVERMLDLDLEEVRPGPAFLMHVILDRIVDRKFLAIEALEDDLDMAEEKMLANVSEFSPASLLHLRRDLLALRKSLFHEREILVKICRKDCPFIPESVIFPYRDIYDHLAKSFELTETFREIVTSLMEMYLSMINNRMTRFANEMNSTVRRLTFITTIFMPLTLLAGIGGMSEWTMMTGASNWRIAYPAFIVALVLLGILSYYFLKWLEERGRKDDKEIVG